MTGTLETIGIVSVAFGLLWFSWDKNSSGPGWMFGIAVVTLGAVIAGQRF